MLPEAASSVPKMRPSLPTLIAVPVASAVVVAIARRE
jgi:hypothetical protein